MVKACLTVRPTSLSGEASICPLYKFPCGRRRAQRRSQSSSVARRLSSAARRLSSAARPPVASARGAGGHVASARGAGGHLRRSSIEAGGGLEELHRHTAEP